MPEKDETKRGTLTQIEIRSLEGEIKQNDYAAICLVILGGIWGGRYYHYQGTADLVLSIFFFGVMIFAYFASKKAKQKLVEDARIREGKTDT